MRIWALAAALGVALVGFQLVYGLRLVAAGDAYWSNPHGDMGQMLAGELAGLRAPWTLPILTPDTLIAPDRVSLVYTDSIPWLTALLKLLHLGRTFSLLGGFLLLSWLAQPAAMFLLLRASGVARASTLLAGSLLALLVPAWLGRQVGHIALSGHAIQILALALAVHAIRDGVTTRAVAAFVGLGVLAAGVHAYHVPPVTLMLAAALASDVLQRREGSGLRAVVAGAVYLLAVIAAAWVLGYFVGRGGSGGVDALGFYEMNLVAPFLPQGSALAGQRWTGAWFTHTFDPTGFQSYEGYNYLGAGGLVLVVGAGVLLWSARARGAITWVDAYDDAPPVETPPAVSPARRWGPLAAALLVLTLYAVGTTPYLGSIRLFAAPLPHAAWMEPLALFRCQGRFFWTVGYAILAGALTVVDRSAGSRLRPTLLAAAVLLQAADMSQMLGGLHDKFSRPEALAVPPALRGPAFRDRAYRAYPAYFCTTSWMNQRVLRQLSVIAERQDASINAAETARPPVGACTRPPPADALVDARPGDPRITVLTGEDGAATAATTAFAGRSDCFAYTTYWMCGRDLAGVEGLTPVVGRQLVQAAHPDAVLSLGTPAFDAALLSGWSKPEPNGVWSQAPRAVLRLPRPDVPTGGGLVVSVEAIGYQPSGRVPQRAFVSIGGRRLAEWRLDGGGYKTLQVAAPADLLPPGRPVDVVIDLPDAISPNAVLPGSGDARMLGIGLRRVTLSH